jgi:hypothetical protein
MGQAEKPQDHTPHPEAAIEHMMEEFEELEGESKGRKWLNWIVLGFVVVAVVVVFFLIPRSEDTGVTASRSGGVVIQLEEPKGTRFSAPPTRFAWDSVTGRNDYIFRLFVEGAPTPVIERQTKDSFLTLTPEESYKLQAGKAYVWTLTARRRDGSSMGTGKGKFIIS